MTNFSIAERIGKTTSEKKAVEALEDMTNDQDYEELFDE